MSTVAARMPAVDHRERSVYTRTQVLGLSLIAGSIVFVIVAGVLSGLPIGEAAFLFIPIVVAGLAAALAWRYGTWAKVLGLVLTLGAGIVTYWLVYGIFAPGSFVEFTAGVAYTLGVLLSFGGGVTAIVKRHDRRAEPTRIESLIDRTALGLVVVAFAVSLPTWLVQRTSVSAEAAAGVTEVAMASFAFDAPAEVAGSDGQVTLVVRNADPFQHTFTVDGVVDQVVLPGSSAIVTFAAQPGDTITYYCVPHSDTSDGIDPETDMAGTLTVTSG